MKKRLSIYKIRMDAEQASILEKELKEKKTKLSAPVDWCWEKFVSYRDSVPGGGLGGYSRQKISRWEKSSEWNKETTVIPLSNSVGYFFGIGDPAYCNYLEGVIE